MLEIANIKVVYTFAIDNDTLTFVVKSQSAAGRRRRRRKRLAVRMLAAETDRLEMRYEKVDVCNIHTEKGNLLLQIAGQQSTVIRHFFLRFAATASTNQF